MVWILGFIIGGAVGYVARFILPTRQDATSAVLTGAVGSLLGVWFFANVLDMDPISSFGTLSLLSAFFGMFGSIFLIALTEIALEPVQKSVKKYEEEIKPLKVTHVVPVYAHQYETVKIGTKKKPRK